MKRRRLCGPVPALGTPGPRARDAWHSFLGLRDSANSWALLADTRSRREFFHTVGANRG